jgi:hypothetical protein
MQLIALYTNDIQMFKSMDDILAELFPSPTEIERRRRKWRQEELARKLEMERQWSEFLREEEERKKRAATPW